MRKLLIYGFVALLVVTVACSKESKETEIPGHIPGMGDAIGELEVASDFVLPDGITLDGEIFGVGEEPLVAGGSSFLKSDEVSEIERGSGGQYIAITLKFANNRDQDKDIVIPAGCLFQCMEDGYQHGLLLQSVRINIKANSKVKVKLNLFCLNHGKNGSHINVKYVIKGVTGSDLIGQLVTFVQGKKIDVSYFSVDDLEEYNGIVEQIQKLVWAITNGAGIDQEGWDFLLSLSSIND